MTSLADILDQIERAFDGVPYPVSGRSLHQANAWDDYETCDDSRDHKGRWQDIPDAHFERCQWALAHLDVEGMHYYLPAAMSFTLRTRDSGPSILHESVVFTLQPSMGDLREYQRQRFARLTAPQRAAIYGFLQRWSDDPDITLAWKQVVMRDRERPDRDDWFDDLDYNLTSEK
ncbi:hypothetical protein DB30_04126 [Enhygromyxa salina]|uniref:Uncharacterized protein n=1 Tax=Enhygromyxa salina TaxID=215803 RepID=A0A0C2DA67_9BACT|nr:DUF6714 family protein [Enhygromyxa salina]KIG16782.1 hypothetical protein DB30_04126 [Enhygromyxa salina]